MIGTMKNIGAMLGTIAVMAAQSGENLLVQDEAPTIGIPGGRRMMQSRYIGMRPNRSAYKGIKAMRSPKPRRESDQINMRDWKPRYP